MVTLRFIGAVLFIIGFSAPVGGQGLPWVFYDGFESGDTSGWWAPARVAETGQVTCYSGAGTVIPCAGTGQDGDRRGGVAWPSPRFIDNGDGTVTDLLTGLVWLRNADCFDERSWTNALADANGLASGACGLTDGSEAGDWRLPSVNELRSLVDYEHFSPALSNAAGTAQWVTGDPFTRVRSDDYWTSSSDASIPQRAWSVYLDDGGVEPYNKNNGSYVWPVRAGN